MKKILRLLACLVLCVCCFFPVSCKEKDSLGEKTLSTIYTVGTFSGYRVDYVKVSYSSGAEVGATVKDYYVDDIFIARVPTALYQYYVFVTEKEPVSLKKAYEEGIVTREDVLAISEAEKVRREGIS